MSERFLPPTPEQMFRITGIAAKAASTQQRLKPSPVSHARFIFPQSIETLCDGFDIDAPMGTEHSIRAHIKKIQPTPETPFYTWSLRLFEAVNRTDKTGGVMSRYSLQWNESSVIKAIKDLYNTPKADTPELVDLYGSDIKDDAATILAAEADLVQMTRGDCEQLAADLTDYCEESTRLVIR